jgi:urease subunit beta
MKPGEYLLDLSAGPIEANQGRKISRVIVKNTGDRPIQVGSHYHFFETNASLSFDRDIAYGMRLNVASGTAVRFEPGEEKEVELTDFGGRRVVHGFNNLVAGDLGDPRLRAESLERAQNSGFLFEDVGKKQEEGKKR